MVYWFIMQVPVLHLGCDQLEYLRNKPANLYFATTIQCTFGVEGI